MDLLAHLRIYCIDQEMGGLKLVKFQATMNILSWRIVDCISRENAFLAIMIACLLVEKASR